MCKREEDDEHENDEDDDVYCGTKDGVMILLLLLLLLLVLLLAILQACWRAMIPGVDVVHAVVLVVALAASSSSTIDINLALRRLVQVEFIIAVFMTSFRAQEKSTDN
jgi:hypothetical protein